MVHAKESSCLKETFVEEKTDHAYNVTVHKDTSRTQQLGLWTASPEVNISSSFSACCELIVQADDEQVIAELSYPFIMHRLNKLKTSFILFLQVCFSFLLAGS